MESSLKTLGAYRYELLPFASAEPEAVAVAAPLTLTVTCSPKHGPDHTVELAGRLQKVGHTMIVHIAARMVRSREHLDALLTAMAAARVRDVFLVGGDAPEPLGPYAAGLALLREMRVHELAPRTIGVPAYPEGHPQIPDRVLSEELGEKCRLADYVVTQMCFDPGAVVRWLERTREAGVELPVYVGVPGLVDRRRLLEISMRVGVGTSISYLRKQHGVHHLLGGARAAAAHLVDAIAPLIGGELGVAGLHFFTFNRLVETERFARDQAGGWSSDTRRAADRGSASIQ